MSVFCFIFLFFISIFVAFLFGDKEKLCDLLAQARVPPSVLVPAVCAVDQNQKEALCCQSSGFCHEPCDISCFYFKAPQDGEGALWARMLLMCQGWLVALCRLLAGEVLPCEAPQPQKFQPLTYGTELVLFHHRAMLEQLQEQLLRGRTEPKALQNLGTPPSLLCLRFQTLFMPAGCELKSLKQRWLPRSTGCLCSCLSLKCL